MTILYLKLLLWMTDLRIQLLYTYEELKVLMFGAILDTTELKKTKDVSQPETKVWNLPLKTGSAGWTVTMNMSVPTLKSLPKPLPKIPNVKSSQPERLFMMSNLVSVACGMLSCPECGKMDGVACHLSQAEFQQVVSCLEENYPEGYDFQDRQEVLM